MAKRSKPEQTAAPPPRDLGLEGFQAPPDEIGLSLDELSETFASLIVGDDPYQPAPQEETIARDDVATLAESAADEFVDEHTGETIAVAAEECCPVSPLTILEAMLFVGHPGNEPLTSSHVSSLMRGVRPSEVDEAVRELNSQYSADGSPYCIESVGPGYRLSLRPEFGSLRERFLGRVREARLSQQAIDVLAVVAYNQPLSREQLDKLRGKPSGSLLSQLVRRDLLKVERAADGSRQLSYATTERFLDLFGLDSLKDLPHSQDPDRVP
jgi:segregation and condensation protein B